MLADDAVDDCGDSCRAYFQMLLLLLLLLVMYCRHCPFFVHPKPSIPNPFSFCNYV